MADLELIELEKTYPDGTRALQPLTLHVADGEFLVLVGPSGCGKSTVLRLIAGLETPSGGEVRIGGRAVDHLPPQSRNVAMVFQNYALYPHMTVRGNLEFPLRMRGLARAERARRVQRVAQLLGLAPLLDRRPEALSGGERQRVAMGRALVRDPAVFLMDEPLSNLDARLRVQIRAEIADLARRTGGTFLYVTHDQVEAMTLGRRVAVLSGGELQQVDTPRRLYERPANVFVAAFLGNPGMSLFPAHVRRDGASVLHVGDQRLALDPACTARLPAGRPLVAGIRPESLLPAGASPGEARLTVVAESVETLGHEQLVYARLPGLRGPEREAVAPLLAPLGLAPDRLVARLPVDFPTRPGEPLTLGVRTGDLFFFGLDGAALAPL